MYIIGISGERGVGKTVAAKYLEKNYGFKRISFADELRTLAKQVFPFNELDLTDIKRKEAPYRAYDWTPRDFLIHLGDFLRYFEPNVLINKAIQNMKVDSKYVIDDMRYPNEADVLAGSAGGHKLLRIERYRHLNPYGKPLDHPSETALKDYKKFDYTINEVQNLTMMSLTNTIDMLMKEWGVKSGK